MADQSKLGTVTVGISADPEVAIRGLALAIARHVEKINSIIHLLYTFDDSEKAGVSSVEADPRYTLPASFAVERGITPIYSGIDGTSLYTFSGTLDLDGTPEYQTIHPLLKKVDDIDPGKIRPRSIYESFLEVITYIDDSVADAIATTGLDKICDIPIDCSTAPSPSDVLTYDGVSWGPAPGAVLPPTSGTRFAVLQEDPADTPVFQPLPTEGLLGPLVVDMSGTIEYEVGESVVTPAFTATYERDAADVSGDIDNTVLSDDDGNADNILAVGEPAPTSTHTYQKDIAGETITWTLTADDSYLDSAPGVTDTVTATWKGRVYWGKWGAGPVVNLANLTTIAASAGGGDALVDEAGDLKFTVDLGAGEYFYLAVPDDLVPVTGWGTHHPILNANGIYLGELFGGTQAAYTVTVTNAEVLSVDYYIYRSINPNMGWQHIDVLEFVDEVS